MKNNSQSSTKTLNQVLKEVGFDVNKTNLNKKPEEKTVEEVSLWEWLLKLAVKLKITRNITLSMEQIKDYHELLQEDRYQNYQRVVAELWILKGNWQYKQKFLEYSDFFPEPKQMEQFAGVTITISDIETFLSDFKRTIRQMYKLKFESVKLEYEMQIKENENLYSTAASIIELSKELFVKHQKVYKMEDKIRHQRSEIERLKDQIEKLTQKTETI